MTDPDTTPGREAADTDRHPRIEDSPIDAEFEETPQPVRRKRSAGGFIWGLFFAVVLLGAGVAAAIYFDLESRIPGLTGEDRPAQTEALEQRIAALEARPEPEAPEPPEPVDLSGIEQRLEALEARPEASPDALEALTERVAALEERPEPGAGGGAGATDGPSSGDVDALRRAVAQLRRDVADMDSAPDGVAPETVNALTERVAALENAPEPEDGGADGEAVSALTERVAALEEAVSAEDGADSEAVTALTQRVAALEDSAPNMERIQDRLDAIEERLTELGEAAENQPGQRAIAALESRLAEVESRAPRSEGEAAYRFAALREAASRGAPFPTEYEAIARLRPEDDDLAAMADTASSGAPTLAELRASFPAAEIRQAAEDSPPEEGRFAWLQRMADNVATVRREGEEVSPSGQAVAAAQAALDAGDLAGAIAATQRLEGAPAEASAYWLERAQDRARLNARIGQIQQKLAEEAGQ